MQYDAVIFDMDGLMLDTEPLFIRAWQAAATELGFVITEEFCLSIIGKNLKVSEQELIDTMPDDFPFATFRKRAIELRDHEIQTEGIATKEGIQELLAALRSASIPLAVATSTAFEEATHHLKITGLFENFSQMVTGDQVKKSKPEPDIYLEAARRLGVSPERCLAFEDSNSGARAASSAGMSVIVVPDLLTPTPDVKTKAFKVLTSLTEALPLLQPWLEPSK